MRYLLVIADDFGIGPATSEGILQLAQRGLVGSSVLMANSPFVEQAVKTWTAAGKALELGWHPALTNDRPILPPGRVPSLVDQEGKFHPLGLFLRRLFSGAIDSAHVQAELAAQFDRCTELLGMAPQVVNAHHHIHVFRPIAAILREIITRGGARPYLRRVREPWPMIWNVPGARVKRLFLNWHGRRAARGQRRCGLPGNDWNIGVTDAGSVNDDDFFVRLIRMVPGEVVELSCHPGLYDPTLVGRDCTDSDGMLQRRVRELELLQHPTFLQACKEAGFELISPRRLAEIYPGALPIGG